MKQKWELIDRNPDQPVNSGREVRIKGPSEESKEARGVGLWNTSESDIPTLVEALQARGYEIIVTPKTIRVFRSDFETLCREIDSLAMQLDNELGTDLILSIPEMWALQECCLEAGNAECETGHHCPACRAPSLGDPV